MILDISDIRELVDRAVIEDLGIRGDVTSLSIFAPEDTAVALIKSKAVGFLSGLSVLDPLCAAIDPTLQITLYAKNGDAITVGTEICRLSGSVRSILAVERIALNFLQRLSGVATITSRYAAAITHTNCRLLDTRKTTPGMRMLEKAAVVHGGGCNHRIGLYDMILIKDTHVKRAGGVTSALQKAMEFRSLHTDLKIEVEIQSISEFNEALVLAPERIMLDNMSLTDMATCVALRNDSGKKVELEASGSVTLETIANVAETGVDFISCGALTHSAPSLDIHLIIEK